MRARLCSVVRVITTLWIVARQALSMDFSKNTGVDCHFLLQGIFLTRNRALLSSVGIGREIPYHCTTWEALSPAQVGCMRQALEPGALGRPGGSGWRGRWEGGSGWGRHVNSRPFHFNVWQNSLQVKKKKRVHIYIHTYIYTWSICYIPETNTTL